MFINTKKHISRRTILRGSGGILALPLLEAMIPASTALAQTAATPKPRFVGCFVPHGAAPGYWVPKTEGKLEAELPFNWKPLEPFANQTVIMSGSAFPLGGAASGRDGSRPLGGRGVHVRGQTQEDRRRRHSRGHDHRSDHRAKDRRGKPDAVHAARGRGPGRELEQLRRGLQLHLHQHDLVVVADRSAADGTESAGGVRAHVRRRQFRRAARRAAQAGSQHSGFPDGQHVPPAHGSRRHRPQPAGPVHRGRPRDRAPAAHRHGGFDGRADRHERAGGRSANLRRTHQAAVRFDGAGLPGRHYARGHAAVCARSYRPDLS